MRYDYVVTMFKCQLVDETRELTFQTRDNIIEYGTNWRALFVVSYDQQVKFKIFLHFQFNFQKM